MIEKLENLKLQNNKIEAEKIASDESLIKNNQITEEYWLLASVSAALYFLLQSFNSINRFY